MTDKQAIAILAEAWGITGIVLLATSHFYTAGFCILMAIVQGLKITYFHGDEV